MKRLTLSILVVIIVIVLVLASVELLLPYLNLHNPGGQPQKTGFHVGVSFGGNTTAEAKLLTYPMESNS
jgi:hypothetical protein